MQPLYHEHAGVRYRVHDELWIPMSDRPTRVVQPGSSSRAAHRVFLTAEGDAYSVQLMRDEWAHTDPASLDRLLAMALRQGRRMRRGESISEYLAHLHERITFGRR